MSLSLKSIASNCLSISPPFSVLRDIFGYIRYAPMRNISLKRQLQLIKGDGININIIIVGPENFQNPDDFEEIDYGIQFARDIYEKVNLCIRKIRWRHIDAAKAGSKVTIESDAEAHDLTDDFSGPNGNYLDVFIVRAATMLGVSPVEGPCSKDSKTEMTGCVVALHGSHDQTGVTLAHEIGHYLGASKDEDDYHSTDPNNFMYKEWTGGGMTAITSSQGNEMKEHCYVKDVC